jgi:two-component system LytT family response regulator
MTDDRATLRAIIVDDEPLARDAVRIALADDADVEIVADCEDGEHAVTAIQELRPDLVFLDVQMPGLDGFDVVEAIGVAAMPLIVFVTAYDAHAVRAFEVNAVDYVLKPFDDRRFAEAVDRAKERWRTRDVGAAEARLTTLLRDLGRDATSVVAVPKTVQRFMVRRNDRTVVVRTDEVDWFEGDGNYVRLHVRGESFRLRVTIRSLSEQLDPSQFARIHRSTIVNVGRIKEIQPWFGGDYVAILHDGQRLRVSRTFAADLLKPMQ